jgi:hypothetical protein
MFIIMYIELSLGSAQATICPLEDKIKFKIDHIPMFQHHSQN